MNVFNSYHNFNYYIDRVKPYNPKGRNQSEEESNALAEPILKLLEDNNIKYVRVTGNEVGYQKILEDLEVVCGL